MKKYILLLSALVIIAVCGFGLYQHFKPADISSQFNATDSDIMSISYKDSLEEVRNQPGDYLLFIYEESDDTEYVWKSLLSPILMNQDVEIPTITYIDTTNVKDLTVTQLKSAFGVERTPSFVSLHVNDDKSVDIKATLTYFSEKPFSQEDLKTWLFENDLWVGPYASR